MQTNRGHASKPLTLLIIVLAIAFTIAAYLASMNPSTPGVGDDPIFYYGVGVGE